MRKLNPICAASLTFAPLLAIAASDCNPYIRTPLDQQLVKIESDANPFAIGVVGGRLIRQPRNLNEAVATALALDAQGFNFSVGCRQINKQNFRRYGLTIYSAFDPKINSETGARLHKECLGRAVKKFGLGIQAERAALSCYYSGNFTMGQKKEGNKTSYVDKVLGYAKSGEQNTATPTIPVISTQSKGTQKTEASKSEPTTSISSQAAAAVDWDAFNE